MKSNTKAIYLDHAATTPVEPAVIEAMEPYLVARFANPSSLYGAARETRAAVETARHRIAALLGARTTEIIFTSGGTEGDNLAVQGVLRAHRGAHWVTTAIEHDAVLGCVEPLERDGHHCTVIPVKPNGIVDVALIREAITDQTVLVSVMLANNEIGTIQPIADVAKLIALVRMERALRDITTPIYLHTDAVQAANYLDLQVSRLGIDLLTLNGSKIYGPKGTGALYVRHGTVIEPLMYGGGQERTRRSGTENVAGIVGFAEAFEITVRGREAEARRLAPMRDHLMAVLHSDILNISINGDPKRRLPNNLNITIPGAEGEAMILYLDNAGIMASTGSACSTGNLDPSHVLLAIGRSAAEANSSLRITLGRSTDAAAIEAVAKLLPPIIRRLREL